MFRYHLFVNNRYYPSGGWNDWVGAFDTLEAAEACKDKLLLSDDYIFPHWHIVDMQQHLNVSEGSEEE